MPNFKYKAINQQGHLVRGTLEAANDVELEARLHKSSLDLIHCKELVVKRSFTRHRIQKQDLINFCFYLQQQHSAGVPILESLMDIRDNMENPHFRQILTHVVESIENGKNLSQALAEHRKVFSDVFVNLIEAGEKSSKLDDVLKDLIHSLKWQDELAAQTKKIMMYPAFIATFVLGVSIFLLVYLTPQIIQFLGNTGQKIPWYTQSLINTSNFMIHHGVTLALALIALGVSVTYLYKKHIKFKQHVDRSVLELPMLGIIIKKILISRFTNYFALMYSADITVLECLSICEKIVGNSYMTKSIERIKDRIAQGATLTDSFQSSAMFPNLVVRMIRIGETTGALDRSLKNVSYFYNRDVEESIAKLQVLIEPLLILLLAIFLGWIAAAVLFPVYDMMGTVK